MIIKVPVKELRLALNFAHKITSSATVNENLKQVLLERQNNFLKIVANNLEQGCVCLVPAEFKEPDSFNFSVSCDVFKSALDNMSFSDVNVEVNSNNVVLSSGNTVYKIPLSNGFSFQAFPEPDSSFSFKMSGDELREVFSRVQFACEKKDVGRREFKSIFVNFKSDRVEFVGTNTVVLARRVVKSSFSGDHSLLIPAKAVDLFLKFPLHFAGDVLVESSSEVIKFSQDNIALYSFLINGDFPDYESIFPNSFSMEAVVKKDAILNALRQAKVIADRGDSKVLLRFASDGSLIVSATGLDGSTVDVALNCVSSNANVDLLFTANLILESILNIYDTNVYFGINDYFKPVLLRGVAEGDFSVLIMPQKKLS
ncbi:MAG: hypothetical protein QXP36_03290 [Conexivisphaerales archaeon]